MKLILLAIVFVLIFPIILRVSQDLLREMQVDGQRSVVEKDFQLLAKKLQVHRQIRGAYPSTEEGLKRMAKKTDVPKESRHWAPSLDEELLDPWGRPYQYRLVKRGFKLWSTGPDVESPEDDIPFVPGEE